MHTKLASTIVVITLAVTLITASIAVSAVSTFNVAEAAKQKTVKCNNIKVQIKVNGVEENQTVIASATIGSSAKTKSGVVEANETSITIPISFKKVIECPGIGAPIFGDVNGTGFTSELKSLKKPNKVTVDL